MKNRPLCVVCIGLMIAIWLCRTAGIPIFGEPVLTQEEKTWLEEGGQVTVTGLVTERKISSSTIRYTLRHVYVTICDRQIPFSGIFVSTEYRSDPAFPSDAAFPGNAPFQNGVSVAEPGDLLRVRGELRAVEKAGNPGQFDAAAYYACQKIWYRLWSDQEPEIRYRKSIQKVMFRIREFLTGTYARCMREAPAGILSAMLMGDKGFLTEESRRNFQAGGCLHLLVISGLHVTLLGMGLLQILLRLRIPQTPACALAAAGMVLYTALTGFPVAAVRACIMFLILVLARVTRRSYDSANSLALAAVLMLLVNPGYLFHAGFQLSFAAAGAASLVSPLLSRSLKDCIVDEDGEGRTVLPDEKDRKQRRIGIIGEGLRNRTEKIDDKGAKPGRSRESRESRENRESRESRENRESRGNKKNRLAERGREWLCDKMHSMLHMIKENTLLWGAVQLCTLPLTAYYFFEIPVWSLPLNLLLVPCVQYVLGAGVIGSLGVLALPRAGRWLLFPADLGLDLYDRILGIARILPGSSVVCGRPSYWQIAVYYSILLLVLWRMNGRLKRKKTAADPFTDPENIPEGKRVTQRRGQKASVLTLCRCAAILAAACITLLFRQRPSFLLSMMDVGQGDCILIQTGKNVFLSDGGSTNVKEVGKYRILPYLECEGISFVDAVCISQIYRYV